MRHFVLGLLLLQAPAALLYAQSAPKGTCPVMPGSRINPKFYVDYRGERIYLCCKACVKAFKKHPEKYLGRFHGQKHPE